MGKYEQLYLYIDKWLAIQVWVVIFKQKIVSSLTSEDQQRQLKFLEAV